MNLLQSEFARFVGVLAVLWLFIEAALGFGALPLSGNLFARILYYLLLLSISYNVAHLLRFINKHDLGTLASLKASLTDNDYKVLIHLESQRNALPSQILSRVFPDYKGTSDEIDSFTRRLAHLTSLGLVSTVGGSEIAITEIGLQFLAQTREDPKYHHLKHINEFIAASLSARIKITEPRQQQTVGGNITVKGNFDTIPVDGSFRLFITSVDGNRIWPQAQVKFFRETNTWEADASLWEDPPDGAYIIIARLGETGRMLYDYYVKVGELTNKWIPLEKFTPDTEEYDRVFVRNGFQK